MDFINANIGLNRLYSSSWPSGQNARGKGLPFTATLLEHPGIPVLKTTKTVPATDHDGGQAHQTSADDPVVSGTGKDREYVCPGIMKLAGPVDDCHRTLNVRRIDRYKDERRRSNQRKETSHFGIVLDREH